MMNIKRIVLVCFYLLCISEWIYSQDTIITDVEYYIDNDPGIGNASSIYTGGIDDSINLQNINIATNNLSSGLHQLLIRAKNANEVWSTIGQKQFYILPQNPVYNLARVEYYIDSDPGVGNGTVIASTNIDSVNIMNHIIASINLPAGLHHLHVRAQNSMGLWTPINSKVFYIKATDIDYEISNIEYYIDSDPGTGNGVNIPIAAADTVLLENTLLVQNNLTLGVHHICIRSKTSQGLWSNISVKKFNACSHYGPISKMDFQVEQNKVFFTNDSEYNDHTDWDFGDGSQDTVLNPIKTYNSAGNYVIKLISSNDCASDTLSVMMTIHGLQRINATQGGNAGVASVFFEGTGFTNTTVLKLRKGSIEILPIYKKFINSSRIVAYFNLNNADIGLYDVIGNLGGGMLDTIKNGFNIVEAKEAFVTFNSNSSTASRLNNMRLSYNIQNIGNEDALMVPIIFGVGYNASMPELSFTNYEDYLNLNDHTFFNNTLQYLAANNIDNDVLSENDLDTVKGRRLLMYMKIRVPSERYVTTRFKINNPSFMPGYNIGYMAKRSMFESDIMLNLPSSVDSRDCFNSFLRKAVRENITVNLNEVEWDNCFNEAYDSLQATVKALALSGDFDNKSIAIKAVYSSMLVKMTQCQSSGMPAVLSNLQFKKIIRDFTHNWIFVDDISGLGKPCIDTTSSFVVNKIQSINNKAQDHPVHARQRSISSSCLGAAASPELAALCESFSQPCDAVADMVFMDNDLASKIGKKIFKKVISSLLSGPGGGGAGTGGGFCGGANSASAGCKQFCEYASFDPNEKYGPGNNDDQKYINHMMHYDYRIYFENLPTASAPAARVEIVDTLDISQLNIRTFQLGNMAWGDSIYQMDANRQNFALLKDLRPLHPNLLRVDITLDTLSGEAKWVFTTLDTLTLQETLDPFQGFLPPNINNNEGQGYVSFSIKPKTTAGSGAVFTNKAKIIFDNNAPIITNPWTHILDITKPQSAVSNLPTNTSDKNFLVDWSGNDVHAGIDGYKIFVSIEDSLYSEWKSLTTISSDTFHGEYGLTYKFISVAKDKAGNYEDLPQNLMPDAITTPLYSGLVISVKNGLWNDATTWSNNQVPTATTELMIKHDVHVNANGICKKAIVKSLGHLNIDTGYMLHIKQN